MAGQFFSRFGDRVAILHSAFTDVERSEQWRRIRSGAASVVVGTRSGVFAPVRNLGLIVVDEEHDGSYKQEETPRYNGRDVAVVRAQAAGACVMLGSATPSLESRYNVERGKYTLLELPGRIEARPMPQVELIDMRQEFLETRKQATFSRKLLEAIDAAAGERRADHRPAEPPRLLQLRRLPRLRRARPVHQLLADADVPQARPPAALPLLRLCREGPERLPEVRRASTSTSWGWDRSRSKRSCTSAFPTARIARLDRDTVTGKRQYETILQDFREGNYDILVGTQMIAKGHDIPNVTLVGVVSADIGLGMPDFRAAERTFQLLTQVAGRAGRGIVPGIVLIQTINPGSLRGPAGRGAGLPGVLREGAELPAHDALPAVQRDGEHPGAQREEGGGDADEHRSRHAH